MARIVFLHCLNNRMSELPPRFEIHSRGGPFHANRPMAAPDRFAVSAVVELRDAAGAGASGTGGVGPSANMV